MLNSFLKWFRPLVVFYFLVFYIFASFSWWAYLHVRKNKQVFELKVEQLQHSSNQSPQQLAQSPEFQYLLERYKGGNWMIAGEGLVFMLILILGVYRIHSGFQRELMLNRQQRNFLLSITHELKSPLAGIQLALETMSRPGLSEDKKSILIDYSRKDVDRLKTLVENILTAARLDNQSISLSAVEMDASQLLIGICQEFENNFSEKRKFTYDVKSGCRMVADPMAIASIFNNLIENAIKYSGQGDSVKVSLTKNSEAVIFTVRDTGFGISNANKKKIFHKFYRVGNEDTRKTQGTGLGLFIVGELAKWHNATVNVADNLPKGSIFTVRFALGKRKKQQNMISGSSNAPATHLN